MGLATKRKAIRTRPRKGSITQSRLLPRAKQEVPELEVPFKASRDHHTPSPWAAHGLREAHTSTPSCSEGHHLTSMYCVCFREIRCVVCSEDRFPTSVLSATQPRVLLLKEPRDCTCRWGRYLFTAQVYVELRTVTHSCVSAWCRICCTFGENLYVNVQK